MHNVLIVAFMCVWIHLFACVNIHLLVCVTIHNIVYCTVYFVLKGRELKGRVGRIVSPPQPIICFVGVQKGQHFYTFFPITDGSRNGTLMLKEANCINFVQIQFGLGTLLM